MSEITKEQLFQLLQETAKELAELKSSLIVAKTAKSSVPRNQRPQEPKNRMFVWVKDLDVTFGVVPRQQMALYSIIANNFKKEVPFSESELFNVLIDAAGDFPCLSTAKQDVCYLFRYYLGLGGTDGKHFGFLKRGVLKEFVATDKK